MTSAILSWTADQLKRGEPAWWTPIAKAWEKRNFVAWSEAWSLYLTCLHFEAMSDAECPLVPYFPSCGGTAEADPSGALARFLANPPPSFYENLKSGHRRTYVAGRSELWVAPAMMFFQRRDLPFYLVEVNSGAGVNLASDLVRSTKRFKPGLFDSDLVAARVGLDYRPLQIEDIADRRWITAGIWPDNLEAIGQLDIALDKIAQRTSTEAAFLQLAACPPEKAAAFVTKNIPSDDPEAGLLIFNMGATVRMSDATYAEYSASMATMLKGWGDRAIWVEVESVRGETYSSTIQLRVHRIFSGQLRTLVMASIDFGKNAKQYNEASAVFLGPEVPPAAK